MTSAALHGLFDIQSGPAVTSPPATLSKDRIQVRQPPSIIELDSLAFGQRYNGPEEAGAQTPNEEPSGIQSPKTPNELEMSRPPSPLRNETVAIVQTWNNPPINKWRVTACSLEWFGNGMNDSGTRHGPH